MILARAAEMQHLDKTAIEKYNIPGIVLMENAGRGTVEYMLQALGPVKGKKALIFVGPGNNGGDGLVIARRISHYGGLPFIIYLIDPGQLKGDAAENFRSVLELNIPSKIILEENILQDLSGEDLNLLPAEKPWAIVDAVFGTGLQRPLQDHFKAAVYCMNRLRRSYGCPTIAVDIPSGVNADTGEVLGAGVEADHTVTYGLAKPGHFMHGGENTGKLHIVDIGIPADAVAGAGLMGKAIDSSVLNNFSIRSSSAHKGKFGHLLVLAGSAGKSGAAFLAGHGALRTGAGLVTLAIPADLRTVFESNLFEAMTLLLADSRRYASIDDYDLIMENLQDKTALAIGPGINTKDRTRKLISRLYREVNLPMVVDADALNILAMEPSLIADPPAPRILTPHPGEMARLTGLSSSDIQQNRLDAILHFTASINNTSRNVTVVLKGAGTIVCDPVGTWAINTKGNPGMATGGMGDVLTGIMGSLLAQGIKPGECARTGVFIHGLAADKLAQHRHFGYLASEVADMVPYLATEHSENTINIHDGRKTC